MNIGVFSKIFSGNNVFEVMKAIENQGIRTVQFNMSSAGLESLPSHIDGYLIAEIKSASIERQISLAAVSGTFNMIHPDRQKRIEGLRKLEVLAAACPEMGIPVITLCTGTVDETNMWKYHKDNNLPETWSALCRSMEAVLEAAEQNNVYVAIEPEISNVVDSAPKAKKLISEMQSKHLKVVMDGANLYRQGLGNGMQNVLHEAFDLLSEYIILAHAKDYSDNGCLEYVAAGKGALDYREYFFLLEQIKYGGPVILHGLKAGEVPESMDYLEKKFAEVRMEERQ